MVVQTRGEMDDVGCEHHVADANRLVSRGVPRSEQQLDAAIAQEIAVAVDEGHLAAVIDVIAWYEEVALDSRVVVGGLPFGSLEDDRHRGGDERQTAYMVPVQVRQDHLGQGVEVELLGNALLLLEGGHAENLRPLVI